MRRFGLTNLDIRNIDWGRRLVHIREGKGGKDWTIPDSEELLADLKHVIGNRKTGLVFQSNQNRDSTCLRLTKPLLRSGSLEGSRIRTRDAGTSIHTFFDKPF